MNKTDFINEVAKRRGITPRKAYREVNDVMDTLRVVLSSGEKVQLGGAGGSFCLGTFEVLTDLKGERIPAFKGSNKDVAAAATKQPTGRRLPKAAGSKVLKLALNLNKE